MISLFVLPCLGDVTLVCVDDFLLLPWLLSAAVSDFLILSFFFCRVDCFFLLRTLEAFLFKSIMNDDREADEEISFSACLRLI